MDRFILGKATERVSSTDFDDRCVLEAVLVVALVDASVLTRALNRDISRHIFRIVYIGLSC
jgi:hypothetical protein